MVTRPRQLNLFASKNARFIAILCHSVTSCGRSHGAKVSKGIESIAIFVIFDHFSPIQVGAGRGAVPRYQHIYFLDRSRRKMSDFEIIWRGLGDSGVQDQKVQLQAQGACVWCVLESACRRPWRSKTGSARESKGGEPPDMRYIHFFGNFNWPRNHGETEVKITVKSKI